MDSLYVKTNFLKTKDCKTIFVFNEIIFARTILRIKPINIIEIFFLTKMLKSTLVKKYIVLLKKQYY